MVTCRNRDQRPAPSGGGRLRPSRRSVSPKQPGSPAVKTYTGGTIMEEEWFARPKVPAAVPHTSGLNTACSHLTEHVAVSS